MCRASSWKPQVHSPAPGLAITHSLSSMVLSLGESAQKDMKILVMTDAQIRLRRLL